MKGGRRGSAAGAWLLASLLACSSEPDDDAPPPDAGCATVTHEPGELDPERTAIVPLPAGEGLLDQCSRSTLERVDGFWTPSEADVSALEAALAAYFTEPCQPHYFIALDEYYAQYVGVESEERRLIYAAFVHENAFVPRADAGLADEPYVLCDGGSLAWGIAYDVDAGTFEALAVNGSVDEL